MTEKSTLKDYYEYNINNEIYRIEVGTTWYGREIYRSGVGTAWYGTENILNPITKEIEPCKRYGSMLLFCYYSIYFAPIVDLKYYQNKEFFLMNGRKVSREFLLAIRNWQIHTRCFDYMECPFL